MFYYRGPPRHYPSLEQTILHLNQFYKYCQDNNNMSCKLFLYKTLCCRTFRAVLFAPYFSRRTFRAVLFAPYFSRRTFCAVLFAPYFLCRAVLFAENCYITFYYSPKSCSCMREYANAFYTNTRIITCTYNYGNARVHVIFTYVHIYIHYIHVT